MDPLLVVADPTRGARKGRRHRDRGGTQKWEAPCRQGGEEEEERGWPEVSRLSKHGRVSDQNRNRQWGC
ncbi:hypothetical protein Mapa_008068 [Marchantia paleacea]|nr:hypothetical protein Mapa_008068 [Marchantia paleacea]